MKNPYTLILPPRYTDNSNVLWKTAIDMGWNIERVTNMNWTIDLLPAKPVIYGEPLFNAHIANQLGFTVVEPTEDFLTKLPRNYTMRSIEYISVKEARKINKPTFIKPPNHKIFPAKVYENGTELPEHLDDDEMVLTSEPVGFYYEARFFILNRKIVTWSPYLIDGKLSFDKRWNRTVNNEVKEIVYKLINDKNINIPNSVVIDAGKFVGSFPTSGTAIIEANEVCGSGFYGCDPKMVLKCLTKGLR